MIDWGVIRQLLHPPPWLLYTWLVVLGESAIGRAFGCVVKSPPGFECDRLFALPMPTGSEFPIRAALGWFLPAGLLFLVVHSLREAYEETAKATLDRFFGRILHADPYALLGTVDQRGLQPMGWQPPADTMQLPLLDRAELQAQLETAFVLVQQAWARQDAMVARTVMTSAAWQVLSRQIDDSRHFRRGGILLVGLEVASAHVLRSGYLGPDPAATVRLRVTCTDPATDCEQDWTLVRPRDEAWLVAAVEPVAAAGLTH